MGLSLTIENLAIDSAFTLVIEYFTSFYTYYFHIINKYIDDGAI